MSMIGHFPDKAMVRYFQFTWKNIYYSFDKTAIFNTWSIIVYKQDKTYKIIDWILLN